MAASHGAHHKGKHIYHITVMVIVVELLGVKMELLVVVKMWVKIEGATRGCP